MIEPQPLTRRQRDVYDFVGKFVRVHGCAPSLDEIGAALGMSSIATVHKHLEQLRMKGWVRRRWNHARSLELVGSPGCCPLCGREYEIAKVDALSAMKTKGEGVELKAVEKGLAGPIPT